MLRTVRRVVLYAEYGNRNQGEQNVGLLARAAVRNGTGFTADVQVRRGLLQQLLGGGAE